MKIYLIYKEWFYEDSLEHIERACTIDETEMYVFKNKKDALQYINKSIDWDLGNGKVITSRTKTFYVAQCLIHGTPYKKHTYLIEKEII